MLLIRQIRIVLFHFQIVDILVKLLSPRQEDDEKQEMAADLRETIERHDEQ